MPAVARDKEDPEFSSEDEQENHPCIAWSGLSRTIPIFLFFPEAIVSKNGTISAGGERYNMAFKIVRTESRLVRGILTNHGFHEVHPNSNDFNLMWTGSHLKPYLLRSLQDFQKVNHFPRSYELTRKDRLYKNIQRMQEGHGFRNFHIVPQTFVLPSEYQEFCCCYTKDKGPWIIKPVASSRGRGIYLVSSPNQISLDENILVSHYINNPLLIDEFKFDMRLYVLVTSYDPLLIYVYEEGLARFATVKYDRTAKNIKNTFMHLTNYSVNKKSSDYVSCDDPEVEDYGNKWSMSAVLRYLRHEGKDTTLLMKQVEDVIIKAVLSAEMHIATACKAFVPHLTNCFELYGFDVLIDSNLKPWLLEVNLSPSLACDAPLDLKIKASMIADMLSLVGLVCQDPVMRKPRSERGGLDPCLKQAGHRTQKSSTAPTAISHNSMWQRPSLVAHCETFKDKSGGESMLGLTAEQIKVVRRTKEEYERRGGFIRIFPTEDTWDLYGGYLESKTSMNFMLANRLFHGRKGGENAQLQMDTVDGYHAVQYERKLPSLEARRRRRHHLSHRTAVGKKKSGMQSKAFPMESSGWEGEDCIQEERDDMKQVLKPILHKVLVAKQRKQVASPVQCSHSEAPSSSEATTLNSRPRVNLLHILQQGWDISKVQARMTFSSYLQRVQQRLLAESRVTGISAWPDKDNYQMELVIRFLKRAASNLNQDIKVVLPSHQLPVQDRRRILSHQLGEFIQCYDKETEHMVRKQQSSTEEKSVDPKVFHEYITTASESDLEEVLTFYTQKNKSATVFLGTKVKRVKKAYHEIHAAEEPNNCETSKTLPVAKEDSSSLESTPSARKVGSDTDNKATEEQPSVCLSEGQLTGFGYAKIHPQLQASQRCLSFPVTQRGSRSSSALSHHHRPSPLPLTPQPPSYAQSLSKSQFSQAEMLTLSGPMGHPTQVVWRIPSSTASTLSSRGASSITRAMHVYSQKLARSTSAGQASRMYSSTKLKSNPEGTFKELNSLTIQAQSNQQAFISALQKLADKQVSRNNAGSSHINLLTQHLTRLNLASRILSRESPQMSHPAAITEGSMGLDTSLSGPLRNSFHRRIRDGETSCDMQNGSDFPSVMSANPEQRWQPPRESYQLQIAVQQLEQQSLQQSQFMDQNHWGHQDQQSDETSAPHAKVPTKSSSFLGPPHHSHIQACDSPVLSLKPPSETRDGPVKKPAIKQFIKQTSTQTFASGSVTSGQHSICKTICTKTGLSVYRKLLHAREQNPR